MSDSSSRKSTLRDIVLVTDDNQRFELGGVPFQPALSPMQGALPTGKLGKSAPSLEREAVRWTYVLRGRERWKADPQAVAQQQNSATQTLHGFGLTEYAIQKIAAAGAVMVQMPYRTESSGWSGRIFPWEFVLASATRRFRATDKPLTVVRHLSVSGKPKIRVPRPEGRVLVVRCLPGTLQNYYEIDQEVEMVRRCLAPNAESFVELVSPTIQELREKVKTHRPDVVHVCGCDTHQGLRLIADLSGPRTKIAIDREVTSGPSVLAVAEFLDDASLMVDGVLLSDEEGRPRVTTPEELGSALVGPPGHEVLLVSLNVGNSAARVAPLLLPYGPLASIGFQDVFPDFLAEYFFEALYRAYRPNWDLPGAFKKAWAAVRTQPDLGQGTGIALWGRAPLLGTVADEVIPAVELPPALKRAARKQRPAASPPSSPTPPKPLFAGVSGDPVRLVHVKELNYSVLHNGGALFQEFEIRNNAYPESVRVDVLVELHVGSEQAKYAASFETTEERLPLKDKVRVPLTASLMRSVSEALLSTLFVQVSLGDRILKKETVPLRLLPVDQWLDNRVSGQWLPSFVLPRDPAVEFAVTAAQRYVRVIRDDPTAGFEGYQNTSPDDPATLDQVDLQVEAIWAAILHEWQLGYINPPPTYAAVGDDPWYTDSQRLRTPTAIRNAGMGTCIDLALLFAACLELVDIYPVIFLLNGHALPGYWRHSDFQAEWRRMADPMDDESVPVDEPDRNAAPGGVQRVSWKSTGRASFREVRRLLRSGRVVPLETVRLTEHSSFSDAMQAGQEALIEESDFDSIIDILTARRYNVTPLPIVGGR